jgi:TolA-binding protein
MIALLLAAAAAASGGVPQAELDDFLAAHARWAAEAADYQRDAQLLIDRKYEDRRAQLNETYEAQLRDLEDDERTLRTAAVDRFGKFILLYPDEPRYTPDAMFRLAELLFEQAKDDQRLAQRTYEDKLKALPPGDDPPPEPRAHFDKPIAIYSRLIIKFPDYKLIDAVYYLLAYDLDQQGDPDAAREIFAEVIQKFPKSRFVAEAWMRLGEHAFDTTDEDATAALLQAAEAYKHVLEHPDHPLYDKALYKLGWTWYRLDRYDDAVDSFAKLIDFYQGKEASAELRAEALQYTAVSFADESWGGIAKAQAWISRLGGRPWAAELYRKLGDIWFDQSRHAQAVEAYRLVLSLGPDAADAPQIQQRIVQSFEREREFDKAWKERDALVKQFSEGSPWFEKNKSSPEVIAQTHDLMERSLYSTAVFHHQQAQAWKKAGKLDLALREFQGAALAYQAYLQRFPHAKNLYETKFYLGETLYNSLQFSQAADVYSSVRDDQTEARYLNESAYAVVLSLQHESDRLERAGKLQLPLLRKAAERQATAALPQELPELVARQIAASDLFIKLLPKDEKAPELAYRSAELEYRFDRFDEARQRFATVLQRWPGSEVAEYASNLTLETWLAEGDWKKVEEFSQERLKGKLDPRRRAELLGIAVGARFKRAQALLDAKKFGEAAQNFLDVVQDDPQVAFADKALNNAAFCYQQELRYDSALRLYERLFTQYPKSPLADTALFLVGFSAEKSFDFDKAIQVYEKLVDNYPQSQKRADALFNEAHALERLQRYPEAQRAYARYAQLFPDKEDAPALLFQGAVVAGKTKDWKQEIQDLSDFVKRYNRNEKQAERIVQADLKIGLAFKALGSEAQARQSFTDAAWEFERRKLGPKDLLAAAAAAEAKFNLAELELQAYDRIRIEAHGRGAAFEKSLKAALNRKAEEREKVLAQYRDVAVKYKRPDWIVAALYRVGYIDERFSAALTEAPVPPELKKLGEEYVAQYQDTLSQASIPIDERALGAYRKAIETARELRIANEWTRRILESLDKYDHKTFPLLKDAKAELLFEPLSPVVEVKP